MSHSLPEHAPEHESDDLADHEPEHDSERANEHVAVEVLVDDDQEVPLEQAGVSVKAIRQAVIAAASVGECSECQIGVRVAGDESIHEVNRQFLQHDYPTDVISFPYELSPPRVEGELIVSLDTALEQARAVQTPGWTVANELVLYVVHGTLHLVGFDDTAPDVRAAMREAERAAMRLIGIEIDG
ncbi:probable rRNA maturation factor [Neorhodopirellula lusitana]|uniref:Endoribonuclease YbeY n=1 Tax=Neorhodopirellula lusitana TaxID=445327 RepID=A0ABY1Q2H7_9BACT|nr:rRNA maturation RNase YbeY [Neorhodopirellula lusitana]SMP53233.1 probable rRNA maturation factor [Neorhodopirellula lusitana]